MTFTIEERKLIRQLVERNKRFSRPKERGQASGCRLGDIELVRKVIRGKTFINSKRIAKKLGISCQRVGCAISRIGGFVKWSERSNTWVSEDW